MHQSRLLKCSKFWYWLAFISLLGCARESSYGEREAISVVDTANVSRKILPPAKPASDPSAHSASENAHATFDLFSQCKSEGTTQNDTTLLNEEFTISIPKEWNQKFMMATAFEINSQDFPDSMKRGFTLTILPYAEMYLKKNPYVNYHHFSRIQYRDWEAIFLIRNDLFPEKSDKTVYWRTELKLINQPKTRIFCMIFGRRHDRNSEPDWCDFKRIVESFSMMETSSKKTPSSQ